MRSIIGSTEVFLTSEEAMEYCRPGKGADTCIWLLMGEKGWECCYLSKPLALLEDWKVGKTVAKRDSCEMIKHFDPPEEKI